MTDTLDPTRIFAPSSPRRVIGCEGEAHDCVDSTMNVCRRRAEDGAPDGYVVLAEKQEQGRGRKGRWRCSPGQGLLMSVFLARALPREKRMLLSTLGSVAVAETARSFGVNARIKWPNDIVTVRNSSSLSLEKLGGVLVEPVSRGEAAPLHVLGVGLNVNHHAEELPEETHLPATSLRVQRAGRELNRNTFCRRLLGELDRRYDELARTAEEKLLARWRNLSCLLGHDVRVAMDGRRFTARVLGIRSTGHLIVRGPRGKRMYLSDDRASLLFGGR